MRHRISGRGLTRTSAHRRAMYRNLAQSLFQHGQIETTMPKAKEVRRFAERVLTLAREASPRAWQRVRAMLGDRALIPAEHQEAYESMGSVQRGKVMAARSGRRHRAGKVPAKYNKKKYPFVASSVVHKVMTEVAPTFANRSGGYTRIIRLAKRRIGDGGEVVIIQLVGREEPGIKDVRKSAGRRRKRTDARVKALKGGGKKKRSTGDKATKGGSADAASPAGDAAT